MSSFSHGKTTLVQMISYEMKLILLALRLFGPLKALVFAAQFPHVVREGSNRTAYGRMGTCRLRVAGKVIIFTHPDLRFIDEIIIKDCYLVKKFVQPAANMTIVDAGANVGTFTLWASTFAIRSKIYAIEPEKATFALLSNNVKANHLENVVLVNAAIAAKTGHATLYLRNPGSDTLLANPSLRGTQVCDTLSIQDFMDLHSIETIDFFKIDIEGSEYAIFDDLLWLQKSKVIVLEAHADAGMPLELVRRLRQAGFRVSTNPAYDIDTMYIYAYRVN